MAESEKKKNVLVPILIIILIVVVVAGGVVILKLLNKEEGDERSLNYTSGNGIGYEMNAVVLTSGDIAVSQPDGVAIKFKPIAKSEDGVNFSCEIANSLANKLDIYIDIYLDASYEDEIYLSGLLRPGEGITSFKTNRKMSSGTYDVVLVPTTVEDDHKTIAAQSAVYLTLVVD
ncbi:MAG: hypothetical protein K2J80_09000 [Oscillospiraceae bacterium]|nr:hypothetical protein [Oscillospiraceae bacterium]